MTTKSLDYYMSLPYSMEVIPSEEGGWVIKIKELPGCMTQADNWEDVLNLVREAKQGWIETAIEFGDPIPEPQPLPSA